MIVIEVTGGLGNQMFGYAFAKALACKTDDKLCISKRMDLFESVREYRG